MADHAEPMKINSLKAASPGPSFADRMSYLGNISRNGLRSTELFTLSGNPQPALIDLLYKLPLKDSASAATASLKLFSQDIAKLVHAQFLSRS